VIFTLRDAIDILIVAYVIYRVIRSIQGTRATTLVKGLAAIFVGSVLARALSLRTVSWLLDHATTLILVALPVVFYPELRTWFRADWARPDLWLDGRARPWPGCV